MNINKLEKELIESTILIEKILLKTKLINALHDNNFNKMLSYIKNQLIICTFLYLEINKINNNLIDKF